MGKYTSKEDVVRLYEQLTPWDKEEVHILLGGDIWKMSPRQAVERLGINPIDLVTVHEVYEACGDEVLHEYENYEIMDEAANRIYLTKPKTLISMLQDKLQFHSEDSKFTEEDVKDLEKILERARKQINNKVKN